MQISLPIKIASLILDDYVTSGRLKAGEKMPSIRDFQKEYNTSHVTLVQAIGVLEQWGAIERRHGSGCFIKPDFDKTALPDAGKGKLLGLVLPNTKDERLMNIYAGVEQMARKYGYHVVVAASNYQYDIEHQEVDRMVSLGCKAIVMYPIIRNRQQLKEDYLKKEYRDIAITLIDMAFEEQKRSQVIFDNYTAGYDMTMLLAKAKCSRIAFMDYNTPDCYYMHRSLIDRRQGYKNALGDMGLPCNSDDYLLIQRPAAQSITESVISAMPAIFEQWKNNAYFPVGLVCMDDSAAMSVIRIANECGIKVPEELKIVGFDNLKSAASFIPAFPTTEVNFARASAIAAEMAIKEATGKQNNTSVYMLQAPVTRVKALSLKAVKTR